MDENLVKLPLGVFLFSVSFSKSYNRFGRVTQHLQEKGWVIFPEMQVGDRVFFCTKSETQTLFRAMAALNDEDREAMDLYVILPGSEPERLGLVHDGVIPLLCTDEGFVINPDDPVAEVWAQRYAEEPL